MTISLTDPLGSSPIIAAMTWLQGTLLGTIATTVAVVAVASFGVMMLTGRVNVRHGATVIVGCFVLCGASSIAIGIRSASMGLSGDYGPDAMIDPSPPIVIPLGRPANYDPYAGASVPHIR